MKKKMYIAPDTELIERSYKAAVICHSDNYVDSKDNGNVDNEDDNGNEGLWDNNVDVWNLWD